MTGRPLPISGERVTNVPISVAVDIVYTLGMG
jgi:hypothetical protein